MLKRWVAWPRSSRWLVSIAVVVLALAIVWALFVPVADWLAHHDVGFAKAPTLQTARDAARGRLLTLGAGLLAAGALAFTARNFALSREGQVTDRYTRAIEQLGSDKLDVRVGGIYALERIARDSGRDHSTVMEVLTAFIREHSRDQWPPPEADGAEPERLTRPDVQAALTVVGRRDATRDTRSVDFTRANLTRADLDGAVLAHAKLRDATLARAYLDHTDLTGATLIRADLTRADLSDAALTGASLFRAHLRGASLHRAHLRGTDFHDADLVGAYLQYADLGGAYLVGGNLTGADLSGADLTGAHLSGADLTGAR